ncbi:hypothetical protein SSX86_006606 [Deinandra increscens subsp. villosa]|uniref:Transposase n=1 Tax=Deinandra increscens subsp. villosa TaxID=3103831 RepID=A0AAP0H6N0_9ASTR
MSERTSRECLHYFCDAIIRLYRDEFLHSPTSHDLALLYEAHLERHGLPGMIGSIDCMHWEWRNCPTKYRGQYHRGDHPKPTVILEAVASQEMWFWHAFFGVAGSNNDINVLNQSTLFTDELKGIAPKAPFIVNGREYKRGYYLADGIYPTWSTFVKAYTHPYAIKEKKMKKVQEGARKDVERAFRRLKAKWGIVDRKARPTDTALMENIMYACMILHNMTLKDEGVAISPVHIRDPPVPSTDTEDVYMEIRDNETHFQLRFDITEHIANNLEVVLTEEELNANPPPP